MMQYSTDWDINTYYDETEPEEHWNLRKQFMEVHKGKYPEDYLVAFSKALINIDFHSFVYSSPQATPKQRVLHLGQRRTSITEGKDTTPNLSISVSVVRDDVQLNEVGNHAWKPAGLSISETMTSEVEKMTDDELYKKLRAIVNKVTPRNVETRINQIKNLTIDTKDRLQGVSDLIFHRAVNCRKFSNCYALMCKDLAAIQVPTPPENREKDGDFVNFIKLLLTRCQLEFESNSVDQTKRNLMIKDIEECTDPGKKKELSSSLKRYDRNMRMKSVRTIRFIGELFKQGMLTVSVMMRCLYDLIEKKDAERLECLLTTVGKNLEEKGENLNPIFKEIEEIITDNDVNISNVVRFKILDLIYLRNRGWRPKSTIHQIRRNTETKVFNFWARNKNRSSFGAGGRKRIRTKRTAHMRNGHGVVQSGVPSKRMRYTPPQVDESRGGTQFFSARLRGADTAIKKEQPPSPTDSANTYVLPETNDDKQRSLVGGDDNRPSEKDDSTAKEPSMERTYNDECHNLRSESQYILTEPSSSLHNSPAPPQTSSEAGPSTTVQQELQPAIDLDEDNLERQLKNILEEYLNECCTVDECEQDIKESLSASALPKLVSYGGTYVLKQSKTARLQRGLLFSTLIKRGTLPLEDYCTGLEEVFAQVDDLITDIPNIWDCLAEILLHPVCEETLTLKTLHKCCKDLISQKRAGNLLKALFSLITAEKGHTFLQGIWQSSGLTFDDFFASAQDTIKFVEDNKFDFLVGESSVQKQQELSYEQIHENLLQLFSNKASFNDVVNWINANVGERVKDKQFVRTLASAFFDKFVVEQIDEHCTVS